jgi:hypothetical protein
MITTKPPASKLGYNPETREYEVDKWTAICILGPKALVQIRRGKTMACGVFFNGVIREVKTGSKESLGGPWVAMSKGWRLEE